MDNTFIERILNKKEVDVSYWMKAYNSFPDKEWFEPNNRIEERFTIANSMHEFGLLIKKIIPNWLNGSFMGYTMQFKKIP